MTPLRDSTECYIPGHGVTTIGEVRAATFVTAEDADTLEYYEWVATNPRGGVSEWRRQRASCGPTTQAKKA